MLNQAAYIDPLFNHHWPDLLGSHIPVFHGAFRVELFRVATVLWTSTDDGIQQTAPWTAPWIS